MMRTQLIEPGLAQARTGRSLVSCVQASVVLESPEQDGPYLVPMGMWLVASLKSNFL
jgi:hypothetical protein